MGFFSKILDKLGFVPRQGSRGVDRPRMAPCADGNGNPLDDILRRVGR